MEWLTTTFAMILGILLRIAVPILVTILIITILKRLDERWKQETDVEADQMAKARNVRCWDMNNCPADQLAKCKAYQDPNTPCWQVFRQENGRLQERCIGCDIFRHAPLPVTP